MMRDGEEFVLPGTEYTLGARFAVESDGQYFDAVQHGAYGFAMDVAMKISSDAAQHPLLANEAKLLHLLAGHSNVVSPRFWAPASESGDKRSILVLDRWEATLADLLVNGGAGDWKCAHHVGMSMLYALQSVHRLGWLHGDVAPRSLALDHWGQVRLFGFGRAVPLPSALSVGKSAYLSPEALRGDLCDERADLWSVGVVLYRMLTGSLPRSVDASECAPPALPVELAPAPMLNVVRRLLENDRNARFANAEEAFNALLKVNASYSESELAKKTLRDAAMSCRANRSVDLSWENQRIVLPPMTISIIRALN